MESALLYNYRQKGHNAFKLRLRPYKNRFAKKKKKEWKTEGKKKQETRNKTLPPKRGEGRREEHSKRGKPVLARWGYDGLFLFPSLL